VQQLPNVFGLRIVARRGMLIEGPVMLFGGKAVVVDDVFICTAL